MTVLVDEAIWPWRGRRWAHLVTDRDLDELHDLAQRIGMPRVAFQGDHYDVHEDLRRAALELGAVATPAREIVRALRRSGLRRRGGVDPWSWSRASSLSPPAALAALTDGLVGSVAPLDRLVAELESLGSPASVRVGRRAGERLVVAASDDRRDLDVGFERVSASVALHRSVGERGSYVEVSVSAGGSSASVPRSASMPTSRRSSM